MFKVRVKSIDADEKADEKLFNAEADARNWALKGALDLFEGDIAWIEIEDDAGSVIYSKANPISKDQLEKSTRAHNAPILARSGITPWYLRGKK